MNHTPGPWKAELYCVWGGQYTDIYIAGTKTSIDSATQEANARLIAAAPDLLAALESILALDDGDSPDLWHYEQEFKKARDAVAKAKV